jgi:NADH:ubiquinone oxidoreductase subunit F (NADH-binding)/(2Fe-2S) ferredoxin/Fe-S-cluster-containing hydrogenase component 2
MNPTKLTSPQDLKNLAERFVKQRQESKKIITVCAGTGCLACGCEAVTAAFREALQQSHLDKEVEIRTTGCHGFCERGPLVVIQPEGIFYQRTKPADAKVIVERTIKSGELAKKLLYRDPQTKEIIVHERDIPFYKKQMRLVFGKNGFMDPTAINDYIALGGYQALAKALTTMQPEQIIEEVKKSGLRGRGGGGFPTGRKWASCRKAKGEPRYVICNADEGDPGAFMDRSLLEGNPHAVIEGMIIGAYAIGSNDGLVYVRNEYPLAVKNLTIAIAAAHDYGLLGDNILGTGFKFDIEVSRGGGAFVCGVSTALMASLEGKVGEPRAKYIHTVEAGLWSKPSNLNNVETWANVPLIIEKGADWYAQIGTTGSKGTKVFALTGKVNNTGLVEVPMGISLREIICDIGGGVPGNKQLKGVQTGGPSGGILRVSTNGDRAEKDAVNLIDLPVDFDALTKAGSMMGSGGMIVMDEDSCVVDVAKYFLNFLQEESCGKCIPCREGLRIMLSILTRISEGKGEMEDIEVLKEVSQTLADTSLCDLGRSAPNPILSTIRYFHSEYVAHIKDKRCPAGVCKELVSHAIDENCIGCHVCFKVCPSDAIVGTPKQLYSIIQEECIQCGACYQICNYNAIRRVKRGEGDMVQRRAKEVWKPRTKEKPVAAA